jgi:hypothetical protein
LAGLLTLSAARCHDSTGREGGEGPSGDMDSASLDVTQRTSALATRPTTLPPPKEQTAAVGATPGTGWVGHDGAFHYRIPIEVPPGRAGMAPSLALNYSSRDGNGPAGVGFSLEGMSSISVYEKIAAAGGERDRLRFQTFDDMYCLDGQRLVLVSGPATPTD